MRSIGNEKFIGGYFCLIRARNEIYFIADELAFQFCECSYKYVKGLITILMCLHFMICIF